MSDWWFRFRCWLAIRLVKLANHVRPRIIKAGSGRRSINPPEDTKHPVNEAINRATEDIE